MVANVNRRHFVRQRKGVLNFQDGGDVRSTDRCIVMAMAARKGLLNRIRPAEASLAYGRLGLSSIPPKVLSAAIARLGWK
jgi:hypothetical protein